MIFTNLAKQHKHETLKIINHHCNLTYISWLTRPSQSRGQVIIHDVLCLFKICVILFYPTLNDLHLSSPLLDEPIGIIFCRGSKIDMMSS